MHTSSLTSKGQVTIPRDIRDKLGFHPGDRLSFAIEGDRVILSRKLNDIEAAFGICKPKRSASLQDIEEAIRKKGSEE